MTHDPWSEEQIHKLNKGVLVRGVQCFRRALRHLGDAESKHVARLRRGLRVMQRELARRRLTKNPQQRPVGDGASTCLGDETPVRRADDATARAAGAAKEAAFERAPAARAVRQNDSTQPRSEEPSSEKPSSEERPYAERQPRSGRERATAAGEPEGEPVWRLIPHLNESSSKIVSVLDGDGVIRHQSEPVKWLLGFDADALVGRSLSTLLCASSRERAQEAVARMAQDEEKFDTWRFEFRTASGGTCWLEGMASNFLCDPRLGGILVYWREAR